MGISPRCRFVANLLAIISLAVSVKAEGISSANCACVGDTLSFTCKAMGSGSTVWTGSSFDCPTTQNQIIFRHSEFNTAQPVLCGTDIIGTKVSIDGDCYISQLNVTVSNDVNNRTVQCKHNTDIIFTYDLTVIQGPFMPLSDVDIVDIVDGQLLIGWSAVNQNCSSTIYLVTSNDICGVCSNVTRMTNVTCSSLQLTTNETTCTIRVRSMICGYVSSESNPISATIRVPKMPDVEIEGHRNAIVSIIITPKDSPFNITKNISGSITKYKISVHNSTGIVMSSSQPSCGGVQCEYNLNLSSICNSAVSKVNVTVSAVNRLGEGPPSDSITIEPLCVNELQHNKPNVAVAVSVSVVVLAIIMVVIVTAAVIIMKSQCIKSYLLRGQNDQATDKPQSECFVYQVDIINHLKNCERLKKGRKLSTKRGSACLTCTKHAVSVSESKKKVGNVPSAISKICSDFLEQNGTIECTVDQDRPEMKGATLTKGHYQVKCIYEFSTTDDKLLKKLSSALACAGVEKAEDKELVD